MNRKALSKIVTSILLILIGIAAIAILFYFLNSFLKTQTFNAKISEVSLSNQLTITSYNLDIENKLINITIRRISGNENISSILISLQDITGNSQSYKKETDISALESRTFQVNYSNSKLNKLTKITIVPFFATGGTENLGKITIDKDIPNTTNPSPAGGGGGGGGGSGEGESGDDGGSGLFTELCFDDDSEQSDQTTIQGTVYYIVNYCQDQLSEDCILSLSGTDYCTNSSTLKEYSCDNNSPAIQEITCQGSCSNGYCL